MTECLNCKKSPEKLLNNLDKVNYLQWRIKNRVEIISISAASILVWTVSFLVGEFLRIDDLQKLGVSTLVAILALFVVGDIGNYKTTKLNYISFLKFLRQNLDEIKIKQRLLYRFEKSQKLEGYCAEQGIYLAIKDVFGEDSPEMRLFKILKKKYSKNIVPNF